MCAIKIVIGIVRLFSQNILLFMNTCVDTCKQNRINNDESEITGRLTITGRKIVL